MSRDEQLARLAQGWDEAALGYEQYYVPRFAPWVDASVRAATSESLPDGPVLVPCCGTFPELDLLVEHLPGREIVGIDLSEGMVRLARQRGRSAGGECRRRRRDRPRSVGGSLRCRGVGLRPPAAS